MPSQSARIALRSLPVALTFLAAGPLLAAVAPRTPSPRDSLVFRHPDVFIKTLHEPLRDLPGELAAQREGDLAALDALAESAFFDRRGGLWGTLLLRHPLIPGSGRGNTLSWKGLGLDAPSADKLLKQAVWRQFMRYLTAHRAQLGIDPTELKGRVTVIEGGRIIQIHANRVFRGVPVRDAYVKAVVNGGNLVLLGTRNWGSITIDVRPSISAETAAAAVGTHVRSGFSTAGPWKPTELAILPMAAGAEPSQVTPGAGYQHRLVWIVGQRLEGDHGSWEGIVDAASGELLAFTDKNQYFDRKLLGGIYPVSNDGQFPDGIEQPGYPMPFADVVQPFGTSTFTNSSGRADNIGGTLRTTLSGRYLRMNDNCGAIDEVAACSNLDLGAGPGTDCTVPPGHSAGDTHASRSGFFELNRQAEAARARLPSNAWLQSQLTSNMNINDVCNAFWDGQTVNFFKSGFSGSTFCANTGEIAAVFDHEWGHGLDDNDTDGEISSPGESIADIYGMLRVTDSCFGRGFVPGDTACAGAGYGDPCDNCTGVRDLDYEKHLCDQPHDIQWILSPTTNPCLPGRPGGGCIGVVGLQQGPCGQETHCEGMVAAEAGWDLFARDLQAAPFNYDFNTALEVTTQLVYRAAGNIGSWYQCSPVAGGCLADGGYLNLLAADDDDGDVTNGTPHMTGIFAALNRHQIACAPPLGPVVQNSGCAGGPTQAPTLSGSPTAGGAQLSWNTVPGAQKYQVFRTEGVKGCNFGKVKIAEVTGTSFSESGLLDGFEYLYSVVPVGSTDSCRGRMSACVSVTPDPPPATAEATMAFREVPNALSILSGDGDVFLDNCEQARFSFQVENAGSVDLQNVQLVSVTSPSHPDTEIQTPLPFLIATNLAGGACGNAQSVANASFVFVPHSLSFDAPLELVVEVQGTAPGIGTVSLVGTIRLNGTESDFQFMASKTFTFEADFENWRLFSGNYTRQSPGANGTLFHLASSALTAGQCDEIQSPEIRLSATSTLSLFNQFNTEPPSPLGTYDRANVGIFEVATGQRTTIVPSGGARPYNVPGGTPNGVCVTAGQAGWAGAGPGFLDATWNSADLQTGQFANKRVRVDVTYGTDPLIEGIGFQFDEVTLTNFDLQVADQQNDFCPPNPNDPPVAVDDSATTEEATPVTINVLANDSDPDGHALTVTSVTDPPNGSAVDNGDGTVTYTPDAGFTGTDSFSYTVEDGFGGSDSATVTIKVNEDTDPGACDEIDDSDDAVDYREGWHRRKNSAASNGGYHRRMGQNKTGAPVVRLVFEGDELHYFYVKSNIGGTADLFIDNVLQETLSYGDAQSGPENPTFGHKRVYSGLGPGSHELRIVHRSGAVYVDGFGFACDQSAGADVSAAQFHSITTASTASAAEGPVITRTVQVGSLDQDVSVVVEGSSVPLLVKLLDPLGNLLASGKAVIPGLTYSGLDSAVSAPGTYQVQVINVPGAFSTIEISIARTVAVP